MIEVNILTIQLCSQPICTHVVYSVNERVVATVAHRQPVATEPNDVYVTVPKTTRLH